MKFRFFVVMLSICVLLVGCCFDNNSTLTNLTNQLDSTEKSMSAVATVEEDDIDITAETLKKMDSDDDIENTYQYINLAKYNLLSEEYYKADIIEECQRIKKFIEQNQTQLNDKQANAIKDLSNLLYKYSNNINRLNTELNSTITNYKINKNSITKNPYKINAKLNKLSCNSNARCAYYENLLNILSEIEQTLDIPDDFNYIVEEKTETEKPKQKLEKNIDTYHKNKKSDTNKKDVSDKNINDQDIEKPNKKTLKHNIDTYGPTTRNIDTFYNTALNGLNRRYFNNFYGNPYAYGGMYPPYNNGLGYNYPAGIGGYNRITSNDINKTVIDPYFSVEENDEVDDDETYDDNETIISSTYPSAEIDEVDDDDYRVKAF